MIEVHGTTWLKRKLIPGKKRKHNCLSISHSKHLLAMLSQLYRFIQNYFNKDIILRSFHNTLSIKRNITSLEQHSLNSTASN